MATSRIEVPFWPTSADNLSWSADNLIAVGGGESIAILVPRLNTRGPNNLTWDSIVQRVNLFTAAEIPFYDPLSSVNWSIGEELSLRHVKSLDWSPPRLARFGTCALAILHSNHALVLWECVGQPHIKDKWRRCLIVNRAIKAYYDSRAISDPEAKRVQQRIRAFAWLPAVRKTHVEVVPSLDSRLVETEHYLAVSTDGGDILIVKVWSPYSVLAVENGKWGCTVIHRLQTSLPNGIAEGQVVPDNGISTPSNATDLAFSAWTDDSDSRLAYIAKGHLYVCDVHYDESASLSSSLVISEPKEHVLPLTSELSGPLRFVPKSNSLLLFGPDKIMNVDAAVPSRGEPKSHHLDGRWDVISGLAFTANANRNGSPDAHVVSHLSTASSGTSKLPISLGKAAKPKEPNWQNAIQESRANFSASYDLGSNVQERTWGITSSPLGDFVATCISMLPGDSPAHVIQSEQRSTVAITLEINNEEMPLPVSGGRSLPEEISAETLLYEIQQYVSRGGKVDETKESTNSIKQLAMDALDVSQDDLDSVREISPPWDRHGIDEGEADSLKLLEYVTYMRAHIFYEPNMFSQRIDRVIDIALQRQPKLQLTKEDYSRLTTLILAVPNEIKDTSDLSNKIRTVFAAVKAKVDSYGSAVDPEMTESPRFVESCNICHQDVQLESLRWSRCIGGHQFSRCTLTFLSIMEPGISKSCRICNALCINEDALPVFNGRFSETDLKLEDQTMIDAKDEGEDTQATTDNGVSKKRNNVFESQLSLSRLLFAACDKCILCGGKFVA